VKYYIPLPFFFPNQVRHDNVSVKHNPFLENEKNNKEILSEHVNRVCPQIKNDFKFTHL
jgi:hypothetical protein